MRILYLHQHFSTPEGAAGTRSFAFARALAARGHAVTLACGQYDGAATGLDGAFRHGRREGEVAGLHVVEFAIPCGNAQGLAERARAFLRYAACATRLALARPFDLVIASSTPLTVALPALAAKRLRGLPFLFEIRDPWPELPRAMKAGRPWLWAAMDRVADAACRQATKVVALSDGMAATALAHGAAPGDIAVVPNGCDLELFGPHVAPWRPAEVSADHLLAVYAGAHGQANGLGHLLHAASLLQRGGAPVTVLLVGQGGAKPALVAAAAEAGLGNLRFLDPLPKPRLAALLAGSEVGLQCLAPVHAFAEWTAPNKLMDYLAAGLPVVANLGGRAARLLAGEGIGRCGIATPPGDDAALARALAGLATQPATRRAMAVAARAQAVLRWDRRLQAARFCELVEASAPSPPGGALVAP